MFVADCCKGTKAGFIGSLLLSQYQPISSMAIKSCTITPLSTNSSSGYTFLNKSFLKEDTITLQLYTLENSKQ